MSDRENNGRQVVPNEGRMSRAPSSTSEAAEWFLANREELDSRQREDFTRWLRASPQHMEEYLAVSVIAVELSSICVDDRPVEEIERSARGESDSGRVTVLRPPQPRRSVKPRWLAIAATVLVVAGGAVAVLQMRNPPTAVTMSAAAPVLRLETRHGEQLDRRLDDGSVVHLNTDSAVTIRYEKLQRFVLLTRGQADFEVAHDPARPFSVVAGSLEVIARGTNFDVRIMRDATVVTVVNGRVAVAPAPRQTQQGTQSAAAPAQLALELGAGQQARAAGDNWPPQVASVDPRQATAWLHRQIAFDAEPLAVVAAEFNRYSGKPIVIETASVGALRISGVFSTDDMDAFVAFLRSLKGVRVEVTDTRIRVFGS
jgi:transmembrane sensor